MSFTPGTVSSTTTVTVTADPSASVPSSIVAVSPVYSLSAADAATGAAVDSFGAAPQLTITYDPSATSAPSIYYLDPAAGPVPVTSTIDSTAHTVTAALPHFSSWVAAVPAPSGPDPTITWTGAAGNGDWATAGNWDLARTPASTDNVVIGSGAAVTLSTASTILSIANSGSLTINGGSLTITDTSTTSTSNVLNLNSGSFGGAGSLSVTGSLSWAAGLMSGSGTTTIQSGATLSLSGTIDKTLDTRNIVNSGSATWTGTGRIIGQNNGTFTNHGTLDLQANSSFVNNGGVAPTLASDGTLKKSTGTGTATIGFVLNATGGSISASTGSNVISFTAGGTLGAVTISPATGGEIDLTGGTFTSTSTTFAGPGITRINGGTLTIPSLATSTESGGTVQLDSGALTGAGTLDETGGGFVWTAGSLTGTGTSKVESGATLTISGAADRVLDTRTIANSGTTAWTGTGRLFGQNGGTVTNHGTLDLQSNSSFLNNGGVAPTLNSDGTVQKSAGGGTFTIGFVLNATGGSITAASGGNAISFTAGGTLGAVTFSPQTGGEVDLAAGTYTSTGTGFAGPGITRINGGTLTIPSATTATETAGTVQLDAGAVTGSGTFHATGGTFVWTAGSMTGTGTTTLDAGTTLTMSGALDKVLDTRSLVNSGTGTFTGTGRLIGQNGGAFTNHGTLDLQSNSSFFNNGGVAPTLAMDTGFLSKSIGAGTVTVAFVLNLTGGTINPAAGNIISFTGGGTLGAVTFAPQASGEVDLASGTFTSTNTTFAGAGITRINGGTLTIPSLATSTETIGTVQFDTGTLTGIGTFEVTGVSAATFVWTGGSITGSGTLKIDAGATLTMSGAADRVIDTHVIDNSGTARWTGTGRLLGQNNASFANHNLLDLQTNTSFVNNGGVAPTLAMDKGSITKSAGGGTFTIGFVVNFTGGTVSVSTGNVLSFIGGGTFTSVQLNPQGTGEVDLIGGTYTASGTNFAGPGLTRINGGTLTVTGATTTETAGTVELDSGTLNGNATFEASGGAFTWAGGSMSGTGTTRFDGPATLTVTAGADVVLDTRTIANFGTTRWTGAGRLLGQNGGVFANHNLLDLQTNSSFINNGGTAPTLFMDGGNLNKSAGGGTFTIGFIFNFTGGTTSAASGNVLSFVGGGTPGNATFAPAAGGEVDLAGGTFTTQSTTFAGPGLTRINGGTLSIPNAITTESGGTVELAGGGTITGAGTFEVTGGTLSWTGGLMSGTGTTKLDAGTALSATGAADRTIDTRALVNSGTATWSGTGRLLGQNAGSVTNHNVFDLQSNSSFVNNGGVAPTFAMDGGNLGKSAGAGTFTIGFVLNVTGGTINPSGGNTISFTGSGTLGTTTFAPQANGEVDLAAGGFTSTSTTFAGPGMTRINGGTLTIALNATSTETGGTVELDSGTLNGAGTFSATNTGTAFVWTGGVMSGSGTTTLAAATTLTISGVGDKTIDTRTLVNSGAATMTGTGRLIGQNSGTFTNHGTLDLQSNSSFVNNGGVAPNLNTDGTLQKSAGAGTFTIGFLLNASGGTISGFANNALSFIAGGTLGAVTFAPQTNGEVDLAAGTFTSSGTTFAGPGLVRINGGTLTIAAAATSTENGGTVELDSGTLNGAGTFDIDPSTFVWAGGVMSGTGTTIVEHGSTLVLSTTADKTADTRTIDNKGTTTWTGGRVVVQNATSFVNEGLFDAQSSTIWIFNGGVAAVFNDLGTVQKSVVAGTTTIGGGVLFNGTSSQVNALIGVLSLQGGGTLTNVSFNSNSGAEIDLAAGTFSVSGLTVQTGALTRINGGTLAVNGDSTVVGTLQLDSGTQSGTANLSVQGIYAWTAGLLAGSGTTTIRVGGTMLASGTGDKFIDTRTLDLMGTFTWTAGRLIPQNAPTITIEAGALFDSQADTPIVFNGGVAAHFTIIGVFRKSGGTGLTTLGGGVIYSANPGSTIDAESGVISIQSATFTVNGATITGPALTRLDGGTITVAGASTVTGTFELATGTLTGAATFDVTGTFNWTGGVVTTGGTTAGQIVIEAGATLNISNTVDKIGDFRTIDNKGTTTWTAGRVVVQNANLFVNEGLFDIQSSTTWIFNGGTTAVFNNLATVRKDTLAGTTTFSGGVLFNGTNSQVNVLIGILSLAGGGTQTGATFTPSAGTEIDLAGGTLTVSNVTFQTGGLTRINGGTLAVNGDSTVVGTLELDSGTQSGTANLVVQGSYVWTAGVIAGSGVTTIRAGATLLASGTGDKFIDTRTLDLLGVFTWTAGRLIPQNGPTITVESGALFDSQADTPIVFNGGAAAHFTIIGVFRKSGGTGLTTLGGGIVYTANAGSTIDAESGVISIQSSTFTLNGSTLAGSALTRLDGGTVTMAAFSTVAGTFELASGTLTGAATFDVTGTFNWTGGVVTTAGTTAGQIVIEAAGTLNINGTADKILDFRAFDNKGTTNWIAGRVVAQNGGTFVNDSTHSFIATADSTWIFNGGAISTFVNNGLFTRTGDNNTTTFSSVPFTNNGTVVLGQGILQVTGANFTQTATGTLIVTLGGATVATGKAELDVTTPLTLAGTGGAYTANGFTPHSGDLFRMISNTSTRTGSFANIEFQDPVSGRWVNFQYVTGAVNVFFVPNASINDVTQLEGNSGTTPFTFTITLTDDSSQAITLNYATADGTATSALPDRDYQAASGTLSFAPGTTVTTATVLVNGDTTYDRNVSFTIGLSFPNGAHITRAVGVGTILNDDPAPTVSIGNVTQSEGNGGTTAFTFTVSLTGPVSEVPATVSYSTANGTAMSGAPQNDYVPTSGMVTFAPGETSKQITVLVNGNNAYEHNETFFVNLFNPVDATIVSAQGIGTILNDDPPPALSINDVTATVTGGGTTPATFTVSLAGPTEVAAVVSYATADGTAGAGTYTPVSGTLTFAVGETSKQVVVTVNDAQILATGTTFFVNLSNPVDATIAKASGKATIDVPTATTLNGSPDPSVFGQAVTLVATVAAADPATPVTGSVTFFDGGTVLGSAPLDITGTATLTTSVLVVATHSLSATYSGNLDPSTGTASQRVDPAATSTLLLSTVNPSVFGQTVFFRALVGVVAPGAGAPTGAVGFFVDGSSFGSPVTLSGGVASIADSGLSVGTHTIDAQYLGDPNFNGSTGTLMQLVDQASTATVVTSSVDPSVFGQPVAFTATVSAVAPGAGTPTGSVQFSVDGAVFGAPVAISGSVASISNAALSVGSHTVAANYLGDGSFNGSSGSLSQVVNQAATTTALTSSVNPSVFGQNVVFTATVSPVAPGAGSPSGTVQFSIDGVTFGAPVALSGVGASISDSALSVGTHTITGTYLGDPSFTSSTGSLTQSVLEASTTTLEASSVDPSVFGQSVTFTATVSPVAPGAGNPDGTVQFSIDGATFGAPVALSGGLASIADAALGVGSHTVAANYLGDGSFNGSTGSLSQLVNKASTATSVASSENPSVFGQSIVFTATVSAVAPGAGSPGGAVQFLIDGAAFGSPVTLSGGFASVPDAALSVGSHTVAANYLGDGSFNGSTSSLNQLVLKASTTTLEASSVDPSVFGQSVTFTATVSPVAPGAGNPTGSVQFSIDGASFGAPVLLSGGVASISDAALGVGSHTVVANYLGDGSFNGSTGSLSQLVNQASTATSVASSVNPSVFGQSVTFTATVSAVAPGAGSPGGQVQFLIDGAAFGSPVTLAGGSASIGDSALSVGTHTIRASYLGDGSFNGSVGTLSQFVLEASTTTVEASSVDPSVFGQSVTFTATVSPVAPGAGNPGGTVQFSIDGATFGAPVALSGGLASIADAALSVGSHTVAANYLGDASFQTSSGTLSQLVDKASTATVVTSSVDPSVLGQSVTFTATVSPVAPGAGTPGGQVQFLIDGASFGSPVTIAGGLASIADSALSAGSHTVAANYLGDASFQTSTGTLSQTVSQAATSTAVTSSVDPSTSGQQVTFTATVTVVAPGAGSPAGSVSFFDGGVLLGSATLGAGGTATFTTAALAAGTHSITATFTDDGNFLSSTGTLTQTVTGGGGGDTTPPAITISSPANGASYDVATSIAVTYTATDPGDTVTITNAQLDGAGPNIASGGTIDTSTLAAGTHTFTVTARDGAGNVGTLTVTFRVRATPNGLINAVLKYVASGQIASQMKQPSLAKLNAALAALAAGNITAAETDLQDFINFVSAQSGKKIDSAVAAQLIQWTTDLLASL